MAPLSTDTMLTLADPALARRVFLRGSCVGIGAAALAALLHADESTSGPPRPFPRPSTSGLAGLPHHPPKAKRVIFLCQSGAPSQMELFDYKPALEKHHGEEISDSIRKGQRLTTMTAEQKSKPLTASLFKFAQHGQCGATVSELLPHTAKVVDELCFIHSMHTEAINHDPAITFIQTGSQQPGRPSMGSWLSYGLGTENADLPAFVVLISGGLPGDQPLYGRLWGPAFLPGQHQGVKFYGQGDPVLYLSNPPGISRETRRRMLHSIRTLNEQELAREKDPEIATRIAQYELAFRMQSAVPELADLSNEPASTFELYGEESKKPGTYAANCLLARRLVERGVRFVQLYHRDWDHHKTLPKLIAARSKEVDQPSAALVTDLRQRGLLDDTLIVWGGEFGRTSYCQGELTADDYGRDHHPRCFTIWLSGGGVKPGFLYGKTDDFSYNIAANPVHVHDLQATILHLLGIDHERLTYRSQGRDFRLTDIAGQVVSDILA